MDSGFQVGTKKVGSGFRVGTQKVGSSGFRVPGRNQKSGFQWVPGSELEPKKWVPVGSGFRLGTQKVGSGGFRVPTKFCFVPTPGFNKLTIPKMKNDSWSTTCDQKSHNLLSQQM